jgi:flagellar biosynthetic protein FlhB
MQEAEQNRTEQATPFKRTEARKRGQVAKSLDFNAMLIMAGFCALLTQGADRSLSRIATSFHALFVAAGEAAEAATLAAALVEFSRTLVAVMLPVCVAAILLATAANLIQMGPVLSADPIKPQFSRLNPVTGFKRIYNKRLLIEGAKALIKLALFSAIAFGFGAAVWPTFPDLFNGDALFSAGWFASHAKTLVVRILLALMVLGLLDVLWVRWQYARQLMMSRREVKEEIKRREGDPLVRQRLRELQRENLKQARSLGRVREADVLITNPTHLAVALAYDRATMRAPQIIARGADLWAEEMKAQARQHGVMLLEHRSLARRLFKSGTVDQPIPVETYLEVAQVYATLARTRATIISSAGMQSSQGAGR